MHLAPNCQTTVGTTAAAADGWPWDWLWPTTTTAGWWPWDFQEPLRLDPRKGIHLDASIFEADGAVEGSLRWPHEPGSD